MAAINKGYPHDDALNIAAKSAERMLEVMAKHTELAKELQP